MVLVVEGENYTVLVFLHAELLVLFVDVDPKDQVGFLGEGEELLLAHVGVGAWGQDWHLDVPHVDLGQHFIFLWVVLLHFLHHPRVVDLTRTGINPDPTEILEGSDHWISHLSLIIPTFLGNDPAALYEVVEVLLLVAQLAHHIVFPHLTVEFVDLLAVGGDREFVGVTDHLILALHGLAQGGALGGLDWTVQVGSVVQDLPCVLEQTLVVAAEATLSRRYPTVDRLSLHP